MQFGLIKENNKMQFNSQTKPVKNKMIDSLASPVLLCGGGKEKCEKGKMATKVKWVPKCSKFISKFIIA